MERSAMSQGGTLCRKEYKYSNNSGPLHGNGQGKEFDVYRYCPYSYIVSSPHPMAGNEVLGYVGA